MSSYMRANSSSCACTFVGAVRRPGLLQTPNGDYRRARFAAAFAVRTGTDPAAHASGRVGEIRRIEDMSL